MLPIWNVLCALCFVLVAHYTMYNIAYCTMCSVRKALTQVVGLIYALRKLCTDQLQYAPHTMWNAKLWNVQCGTAHYKMCVKPSNTLGTGNQADMCTCALVLHNTMHYTMRNLLYLRPSITLGAGNYIIGQRRWEGSCGIRSRPSSFHRHHHHHLVTSIIIIIISPLLPPSSSSASPKTIIVNSVSTTLVVQTGTASVKYYWSQTPSAWSKMDSFLPENMELWRPLFPPILNYYTGLKNGPP